MASSSEEEDNALLMEALVPGFTINSVKCKASSAADAKCSTSRIPPQKSMRPTATEENDAHNCGPQISPDQQNFIANMLNEYLEGQVKEVDTLSKRWKDGPPQPHKSSRGIRLLTSCKKSVIYKEGDEEEVPVKQHKPVLTSRKRRLSDSGAIDTEQMLREAAVSPEWVLEGQGAFGKLSHRGEVITGALHAWSSKPA